MAGGDTVQQIKDRLDIVAVVSPYVELHKAGKNFKGKSPFTNEKTPSFYVSPDRGMYYCFSSSQGGDIFTFIQVMEGVDFKGALKMLAEKAGVELVPEDPKKRGERDKQYDVLESATQFYEQQFMEDTEARSYAEDRGIKPETRARWRVGYAPGPPRFGWRDLKVHLEAQGFTKDELGKAGLIKGFDTGKEPYDVFRDRVIFPLFDASGRVVAFSGRILTKDSDAPKYVNSPETDLFVKSDILYGYDKAKEGMRKLNFSLIVEGQFDVVLAHQAGYNNTVAVSGTALTPHHVDLLQRLTNRVVLALDNDRAGIAAVKRAADLMLARSMDVKVAAMNDGEDPADMIRNDVERFKTAIKDAQHVVEFLLDVTEKSAKDERTFKLQVREEVLPYVAKIPNAIDREHFEGVITKRVDTTQTAIHTEVQKLLEEQPVSGAGAEAPAPTATPSGDVGQQFENYAEQIFGALLYLKQFPDEPDVTKKIERSMEEVLGSRYQELAALMHEERLNHTLMQFERTFEGFPNREFFENLVAKLNRFYELHLKAELQEQSHILKQLEQTGELGAEYEAAMQKAQNIQEKLKTHPLTTEDIL